MGARYRARWSSFGSAMPAGIITTSAIPVRSTRAFQGYGTATTDDEGRYAFVTIRPVAYPGRPPHLHFTLRHSRAASLTTQLYVAGDDTSADSVLSASARGTLARLTVALGPAPDREIGALEGSFDFVLAAR